MPDKEVKSFNLRNLSFARTWMNARCFFDQSFHIKLLVLIERGREVPLEEPTLKRLPFKFATNIRLFVEFLMARDITGLNRKLNVAFSPFV